MRKVKFRVWDEERKKIQLLNDIHDSLIFHENGDAKYYNLQSAYTGILMQWTGLKDKNGFDIYEGDILTDRHTEELCQIEFEEGKFVASFSTYVTDLSEVYQDLEIVGNIYENKELLKIEE